MITGHHLDSRPGRWRAGVIYSRIGTTGLGVHDGAPVEAVPDLMAEFVETYNSIRESGLSDPLVTAAMAHVNLVLIHPFRDGNGRMARCLQTLILTDSGTISPIFSSIEEYLGLHTQDYYDALARVGGGNWNSRRDARSWLRFCLTAHLRQALTLQARIRVSERLWLELERVCSQQGLPERVLNVLHDAALGLRVRNATYRAVLANQDPTWAK